VIAGDEKANVDPYFTMRRYLVAMANGISINGLGLNPGIYFNLYPFDVGYH
jgi:hypothetical protein